MFFKNMLKSVKTELTQIGTSLNETFKESNVTVSANAHVQPTPVVSNSTSGNVQPGICVTSTTTTTSYDTTYHYQPRVGVNMGVQPTVGMNMNVGIQPTVGMNVNMGMQPTVCVSMGVQNSTYTQPTVGMHMEVHPSVNMNMGMPTVGVSMGGMQPTVGMNMNMGVQPTVGMNVNMGMQPTYHAQPSVGVSIFTILAFFDFIHDRVEVINQLKSTRNIGQMSCTDAVSVMDVWGSNEKLDILQMISPLIYDRRQNAETIVSVFAFSSDKDEARKLLLYQL